MYPSYYPSIYPIPFHSSLHLIIFFPTLLPHFSFPVSLLSFPLATMLFFYFSLPPLSLHFIPSIIPPTLYSLPQTHHHSSPIHYVPSYRRYLRVLYDVVPLLALFLSLCVFPSSPLNWVSLGITLFTVLTVLFGQVIASECCSTSCSCLASMGVS